MTTTWDTRPLGNDLRRIIVEMWEVSEKHDTAEKYLRCCGDFDTVAEANDEVKLYGKRLDTLLRKICPYFGHIPTIQAAKARFPL